MSTSKPAPLLLRSLVDSMCANLSEPLTLSSGVAAVLHHSRGAAVGDRDMQEARWH